MEHINKPLDKVQQLFTANAAVPGDGDWGVTAFFQQLMNEPGMKDQVHWLSLQSVDRLPNQCLVRFRGMVQDTFNPEYYLGAYQDLQGGWHTTKYADILNAPSEANMQQSCIWERKPVVVVPVPGQSAWCTAILSDAPQEPPTPDRGNKEVRKRNINGSSRDSSMTDMEVSGALHGGAVAGESGMMGEEVDSKPRKEAKQETMNDASMEVEAPGTPPSNEEAAAGGAEPAEEYSEGDCIVYIYDEATDLKLHDVVEVIGVLSKVPQLGALHMLAEGQEQDLLMQEHLSTNPPTSKVFRLHAILTHKHSSCWPTPAPAPSMFSAQIQQLRSQAIQVLKLGLAGDELAAEYLLLQLLSQMPEASHQVQPKLPPLNLCGCPPAGTASTATPAQQSNSPAASAQTPPGPSPFAQALQMAVSALWPSCACLPVSVPLLNSTKLAPWKAGSSVRLHAGPLQLGRGTPLFLDETTMSEGTIQAAGLDNLRVLQHLMTEQLLYCDFEVYTHSLPMDVPIISLSERRSFFREVAYTVVPTLVTSQQLDAARVKAATLQMDLHSVRQYLCAARAVGCEVKEDAARWVEQALERGRADGVALGSEELHRMVLMARTVGSSFLEPVLTEAHWQHMRALEARREARVRVV